jgi:hypothetical protein
MAIWYGHDSIRFRAASPQNFGITHGVTERQEAGAESAEMLTGQDGHFLLLADELAQIIERLQTLVDSYGSPAVPDGDDRVAIHAARDVFARLTTAQQLATLRRFAIRVRYLEVIRATNAADAQAQTTAATQGQLS